MAVDALCTEDPDIALHQFHPLLRIGGALLGQHAEEQRVCHPVVHHGEYEDIDVGAAELSVGPVHSQAERAFHGLQTEDVAGDKVPAEVIFEKKRWILRK